MKTICKKSIVISIILLLIGVSVSSAISVDTKTTISNSQSEECKECKEVSKSDLLKVDRLLNKVEVYSKLLSVLSRFNPEVREISEELFTEISTIINLNGGNGTICAILWACILPLSAYGVTISYLLEYIPKDGILYSILENHFHLLQELWKELVYSFVYVYECV